MSQNHQSIYDIFDLLNEIELLLNRASYYADKTGTLPNSLQSMLGKIARYEYKTVSELAEIYDIDLKNTTRYVNELYRRGYVEKQQKGAKKPLFLTPEGWEVFHELYAEKAEMLRVIEEHISETLIHQTREGLLGIVEGLKQYETLKP